MEMEGQEGEVMFIVDRVMSMSKSLQCCHSMHSLDSPHPLIDRDQK
jgi:hypothetical protein